VASPILRRTRDDDAIDDAHVVRSYCLVNTVPSPKFMVLPDIEKLTLYGVVRPPQAGSCWVMFTDRFGSAGGVSAAGVAHRIL
jgi:hypothetical protein